jgi:hypothetical protein
MSLSKIRGGICSLWKRIRFIYIEKLTDGIRSARQQTRIHPLSSLGPVPQIKWSREKVRAENLRLSTSSGRLIHQLNILKLARVIYHATIIFVYISWLPLWPCCICRPESTAVSAFDSIYPDYFCWIGRS